jgi:hypothetical protein
VELNSDGKRAHWTCFERADRLDEAAALEGARWEQSVLSEVTGLNAACSLAFDDDEERTVELRHAA